jgi:site-specific DNA recombinase
MARSVKSAAVYARISSDDGQALGVSRQLEDCRKLAGSLGWPVGEEYVDNDISAYSGKPRAEYQRMLTDLADGARDAVLVYHVDRLTPADRAGAVPGRAHGREGEARAVRGRW